MQNSAYFKALARFMRTSVHVCVFAWTLGFTLSASADNFFTEIVDQRAPNTSVPCTLDGVHAVVKVWFYTPDERAELAQPYSPWALDERVLRVETEQGEQLLQAHDSGWSHEAYCRGDDDVRARNDRNFSAGPFTLRCDHDSITLTNDRDASVTLRWKGRERRFDLGDATRAMIARASQDAPTDAETVHTLDRVRRGLNLLADAPQPALRFSHERTALYLLLASQIMDAGDWALAEYMLHGTPAEPELTERKNALLARLATMREQSTPYRFDIRAAGDAHTFHRGSELVLQRNLICVREYLRDDAEMAAPPELHGRMRCFDPETRAWSMRTRVERDERVEFMNANDYGCRLDYGRTVTLSAVSGYSVVDALGREFLFDDELLALLPNGRAVIRTATGPQIVGRSRDERVVSSPAIFRNATEIRTAGRFHVFERGATINAENDEFISYYNVLEPRRTWQLRIPAAPAVYAVAGAPSQAGFAVLAAPREGAPAQLFWVRVSPRPSTSGH